MHQSSMDKMRSFRKTFLQNDEQKELFIIDFGSQDVGEMGTYKDILNNPKWQYLGVDMSSGKNVDLTLKNPYNWKEIPSSSVDLFVSGQAFEHIEYYWITMLEVYRVLKPGGKCCIIAPSGGYEHRYPVDCWRFYPDGFLSLARFSQLEVLQSYTQWKPNKKYTKDDSNGWKDSVLVAVKPKTSFFIKIKSLLKNRIQHLSLTYGIIFHHD